MDKNQVGKIASAVVAAAGPMLAGYAANAVKNRLSAAVTQPKKAGRSAPDRAQIVRNAPVALSQYQPKQGFKTAAPITKGASARFVGCDFVATIPSATTDLDNAYEMTPTNSTPFPRLSAMSKAYELYKFNKIRAVAIGIQPSTIGGSMTLAPDLYPDGTQFTATEIRNEEGQSTTKFWEVCAMDFPCSRGTRQWFLTDNAGVAAATDAKLGDLHFFTDATGSVLKIADLFIEYDIEFAQCQAVAAVDLDSPMARRLMKYDGGSAALLAAIRCLLPEDQRHLFDEKGRLKKKVILAEHSDTVDEFLRTGVLPVDCVQKPIPAAALRTDAVPQGYQRLRTGPALN